MFSHTVLNLSSFNQLGFSGILNERTKNYNTWKATAETILYEWNQSDQQQHKCNQNHIKLLALKNRYFSLSFSLVINISLL